MLPLERDARTNLFRSRSMPSITSGHGASLCHTRLRWSVSLSLRLVTPCPRRRWFSFSRCSTSTFIQGRSPRRILSMPPV